VIGKRCPAAVRSCKITRSSPDRCSLTECSTCNRVFISMNRSTGRPSSPLSSSISTVPAPT
jgi:hypothetical protein